VRVAVLCGGRSSEHDVSLSSGEAVRGGLADAGHDVVDVRIDRDGVWHADGDEVALVPGRGVLGCDVVFPVLHGPFGEDGTVQGLLECLGVPYVGAAVLASALCMDKVVSKDVLAQVGAPQVDYRALRDDEDRGAAVARAAELGFPLFVKPARLGSSVGIARVEGEDELPAALDAAFRHDPVVIAEALATGLEVECSVLGNRDPEASVPGEIVLAAGESGWYDYEAKYTPDGMELVVPARISDRAREEVRRLAVWAFRATGCEGLARVDFFVDGETVLLNELNTMPGFTATSVYAKLWAASGVGYADLLDRLVALALERQAVAAAYAF
jgi:D-alanine-D-alanine ligase